MKIKGVNPTLARQPGSEIDEAEDGTLRGFIDFEGDKSAFGFAPVIGSPHPDDSGLVCYGRKRTFLGLEKIRVRCDYFGLRSDPTPTRYTFIGSTGEEPIVTHPDFVSKLGGTPASPKNGAIFDDDGVFQGFHDLGNKLCGAETYLDPRIIIRRTYWTYRAPSASKLGDIVAKPSGIIAPSAKNYLQTSVVYDQVGAAYKVGDEISGSGRRGFDPDIYS